MALNHPEDCIRCGTCVSVCPVEKVGGHAIVTFLADPAAQEYSVWLCSSCWRCHESCPVDIDIYGLMMEQRREEHAPQGYRDAYKAIVAKGLAVPITQKELDEMRASWDLEPTELPKPDLVRQLLNLRD